MLVNYHAPNDEQGQPSTLNEISDKLKTLSVDEDTRLIWRGDWNCIHDKSLDAIGESPSLKKESVKLIQNLTNGFDLVDVWRLRNPTYKKFSWRPTKPVAMRRLDFFLVSDKMELDFSGCGFYTLVQNDLPQFLLRFPHTRRLLEGQATGSLIVPLSMTPLLLKRPMKLLMRLQ